MKLGQAEFFEFFDEGGGKKGLRGNGVFESLNVCCEIEVSF